MSYDLAQALKQPVGAAVQALVKQLSPGQSPWYVFPGPDALRTDFTSPTTARLYWSYGGGEFDGPGVYSIYLSNITLQSWASAKWGKASIIKGAVPERYLETIKLVKGSDYDDTFTHTFSTTTSLLDAIDASSETELHAQYGGSTESNVGIKETLKVAYQHQIGSGSTTSDTMSRHLVLHGPGNYVVTAARSTDKMSRPATVVPAFEFAIRLDRFNAGTVDMDFKSWAEWMEFLQGRAPDSVASFDAGPPVGMIYPAQIARENPQDTSPFEKQGGEPITLTFQFDNVIHQAITVWKTKAC